MRHLTSCEDYSFDDLAYANGVRCNTRDVCPIGSRDAILADIIGWVNMTEENSAITSVMWLAGGPSSGKSTIANSVFQHLDGLNRAVSFCVDASDASRNKPWMILPTLARDIADIDPGFKAGLYNSVHRSRAIRTSRAIHEQIVHFLEVPSSKIKIRGPILIVIDGIDEIGDRDVPARRAFLDCVSTELSTLSAKNLRILVTSRIKPDIYQHFTSNPRIVCKFLHDSGDSFTRNNLTSYIGGTLDLYAIIYDQPALRDWRSLETTALANVSHGSYSWANMVVFAMEKLAQSSSPMVPEQLTDILSTSTDPTVLLWKLLRIHFLGSKSVQDAVHDVEHLYSEIELDSETGYQQTVGLLIEARSRDSGLSYDILSFMTDHGPLACENLNRSSPWSC